MVRLGGMGLIGTIAFVVWIYAILDSIAMDSALVRNLPKVTWVLIVLFFGPIGAMAWLGLGRPTYARWRPGDTRSKPVRRVIGVEDNQRWTHARPPLAPAAGPTAAELEARERRLREWEAELNRRDESPPSAG